MRKKPELPNPDQLKFGTSGEAVPPGLPAELSPEQRISVPRLLTVHAEHQIMRHHVSWRDILHASPRELRQGLYVHPQDPNYEDYKNLARIGVPVSPRKNTRLFPQHFGIIFPPDEFLIVAHNPRGMAERVYAKTDKVLKLGEVPSEREARSKRSAGHALTNKLFTQGRLAVLYTTEIDEYLKLKSDAIRKGGARMKAKNVDGMRGRADERLHQVVESVGERQSLTDKEIAGAHRAIRRRVYSGNYSADDRVYHFLEYLGVLRQYKAAELDKLKQASERVSEELKEYQPYIDAKYGSEQAA